MTKSSGKKDKFGIDLKISIICGINVLVLLAVGSFMLLNFEYSLTKFFVKEYIQKIERTIAEQEARQKKFLKSKYEENSEIAAGIAAPFVFNLDSNGIMLALERYMGLDEMLAIKVVDADGTPFFAMWKKADGVTTGATVPDTVYLDKSFSAAAVSYVREEKVGHVEIYYTDTLLAGQTSASREMARKEIEDFRLIIEKRISRAFIAQVLSVLCVILVLVGSIGVSLHFFVLKPMKDCLHFAQRMSDGDFSGKIDVGTSDEIGALAGTLNHMSLNLGQVLAKISEGMKSLTVSSANLLATAQKLATGSEELTVQASTAAKATENINHNIFVVTNTAETMSVQSQSIASSAKEISTDVNSVASSIEEISASIQEVAQNCAKAQFMAQEAHGASQNAENKMTELVREAQDIGNIIGAIEEITEQIKLLALNATIEAARSGEAGKGFSVVANEVKNLALQTSKATQDIAQQIGGIQDKTSSVVADIQKVAEINSRFTDHTNTIAAAVEVQNSTTAEIVRIVGEVAQNCSNVSNLVESFSRNIEEEVVTGLKESHNEVGRVSCNNQRVNNVAQETAHAASSINEAARELSLLANELQQQVNQFKTS
ncbi:MAG TPA: hypothetical protein DDY20_01530 [Desulfobulbaceae bacterium]|nr:hypothetical protein [Desulfobulbaceae bacterium]